MILYSTNRSPYSAPVRIAVRAKDIDIEIAEPPGGLGSSRFSAINPVGTIPCLVLDDGVVLPESVAIMEFLEEMFPRPPLMPSSPQRRAEIRVLRRIAELGVLNPTVDLLQMVERNTQGAPPFGERLTRLVRGLASADLYVSGDRFAVGEALTLADCQLAPALHLVKKLARVAGAADLVAARPKLARYLEAAREDHIIDQVLTELAPD
jgi:glutathione S-transferase